MTELDVTAGSDGNLSEEDAQRQAQLYAQLFAIYKENAEHISRVTFWGMDDGSSWRSDQNPFYSRPILNRNSPFMQLSILIVF